MAHRGKRVSLGLPRITRYALPHIVGVAEQVDAPDLKSKTPAFWRLKTHVFALFLPKSPLTKW